MSYATIRDIYHLLEADRPDEPRRLIPVPVAECDKSNECHTPPVMNPKLR